MKHLGFEIEIGILFDSWKSELLWFLVLGIYLVLGTWNLFDSWKLELVWFLVLGT
jgi:hypothetical protein